MSWLRIDDGFAAHPKVTALTFRERWTWVSLLCYCARYKTEGRLPDNIKEHVQGATENMLKRCDDLGLLDHDDAGYVVHDWTVYSPKDPTASERQATWRARKRNGNVDESAVIPPLQDRLPRARASRPVPSPSVNSSASYVEPARAIERLLNILPDADPQTATTVRSLCRRHRLAEGDVEWARECATGPGVNFPSRVAVGELVKRGEAKAAS